METVFDYNITDKEREDIGISEKENYLAFIDEESANWGIAQLMYYRGDKWKSHSTLTLLATQDLPTFLYYMIDPLKSWCWGAILFYPFKNSRFS